MVYIFNLRLESCYLNRSQVHEGSMAAMIGKGSFDLFPDIEK